MASQWEIPTQRLWGRLERHLTNLRTRGMANPRLDDLTELTGLSAELVLDEALARSPAEGGRYWEQNSDEELRRIEVLLECAIDAAYLDPASRHYKPPEATVARLWFGLDPKSRGASQGERHEMAAESAGIKKNTMEVHRGAAIKTALAQTLTERYEGKRPFTLDEATAQGSSGDPPKADARVQPLIAPTIPGQRFGRSIWAVIGASAICAGAMVLLVALGVFDSRGGVSEKSLPLPPRGAAIDATTGKVDPRPTEDPPPTVWPLRKVGRLVRVCDLTAATTCAAPTARTKSEALEVSSGDTIRFQAILDAKTYERIPFLRLAFNAGHEEPAHVLPLSPNELQITREIYWPVPTSKGGPPEVSTVGPEAIRLKVSGRPRKQAQLRYVPASTVLLNSQHGKLGRLPDGIMNPAGVKLTNLGAPASCQFNCELRYLRLVQFVASVRSAN